MPSIENRAHQATEDLKVSDYEREGLRLVTESHFKDDLRERMFILLVSTLTHATCIQSSTGSPWLQGQQNNVEA